MAFWLNSRGALVDKAVMVNSVGNENLHRSVLSQLSTLRIGVPSVAILILLTWFFVQSDSLYRSMQSPTIFYWIAVHLVALAMVVVATRFAFRVMQPVRRSGWKVLLVGQLITFAGVIFVALDSVSTPSLTTIHGVSRQTLTTHWMFIIGVVLLVMGVVATTEGTRRLFPRDRSNTPGGLVNNLFLVLSSFAFVSSLFYVSPQRLSEINQPTYWTVRGAIGLCLIGAVYIPARIALSYRSQPAPYFGPILMMQVLQVFLLASVMQDWSLHPFALAVAVSFLIALSRGFNAELGGSPFTFQLHSYFPEVLASLGVGGIIVASWYTDLTVDARVETFFIIGISAGILVFGLLRYTFLEIRQYQGMTELTDIVAQVRTESRQDPLTRLANRSALQEDLDRIMSSNERQSTVTLFFIDLDYFKQVNDSLGHQAGDELLRIVSRRLQTVFGNAVYRLGGDEFVAVRTDIRREAITEFMTRVYAELSQPLDLAGTEFQPEFSVGVARSEYRIDLSDTPNVTDANESLAGPNASRHAVHDYWSDARHPDGPQRLMQRADLALYRAKELGRNQFVEYDPSFRQHIRSRREHMKTLREVLTSEALGHTTQLAIRPSDDSVCGEIHDFFVETDDEVWAWAYLHGLAVGDGFLHDLLIKKVTQVADYAATEDSPRWHSINLSRHELTHPECNNALTEIWGQRSLERRQLKLNVNEQLMEFETCRSAMQALVRNGFDVAISGFGEAPSSLLALAEYPATTFVWSPQIIERLGRSEVTTAVVHTIGDLARSLSLQWGAAGVAEKFQYELLRELNAAFITGPWVTEHFDIPSVSVGNHAHETVVQQ